MICGSIRTFEEDTFFLALEDDGSRETAMEMVGQLYQHITEIRNARQQQKQQENLDVGIITFTRRETLLNGKP